MDLDPTNGGDPHDTGPGGNLNLAELSIPPYEGEDPADRRRRRAMRSFVYNVLRKAGQENDLLAPPSPHRPDVHLYAMPLLCGDNPLSNEAPSKFLRLTDTMLFLLKQWAEGNFIDETREDFVPPALHRGEGPALDHGVLGNALGGSFCPGGEASWIMRNPAIYASPYRIRHAAASQGVLSQPAAICRAARPPLRQTSRRDWSRATSRNIVGCPGNPISTSALPSQSISHTGIGTTSTRRRPAIR